MSVVWRVKFSFWTVVSWELENGLLKLWSPARQQIWPWTSILKVLLKQYKSPTGPNKFPRGVTPTNTDQSGLKVEVDVYYFDTNSSKKF